MAVRRRGGNVEPILEKMGIIENLDEVWATLQLDDASSPSPSSLPRSSSRSSFASSTTSGGRSADTDAGEASAESTADEGEHAQTTGKKLRRKAWKKSVMVDISCDSRLLVMASAREIVILSGKWKGQEVVFSKFWKGSLVDDAGSSEVLTCCRALSIASRHRSSPDGVADWTCVVYGFQSGFVAFHTETGYTVHRQQFDTAPVRHINFHSPPHTTLYPGVSTQELVVVYENGVVVLIGASDLYAALQEYKNSAADAISKHRPEDDDVEMRSIPHAKFQLDSHQTIHDVISLGSRAICGFDQLLNASVLGGSHASIKMPLPGFRRLVAVGGYPLCSSYFISDAESGLELGQVAKAVATKLTSALTSKISSTANRFGLSGLLNRAMPATKEDKKKLKVLPKSPRNVDPRFGLFDERRCATSVVLSSSSRLAAMTDFFGRVLLLDCSSGLIVRMWKGYRSAQLAWLTVKGTTAADSAQRRTFVECVVIYAPRRHLLEVWTALSGRRLVAQHVDQGLRLLSLSPRPLHPLPPTDDDQTTPNDSCYLLHPNGQLFTLKLPYYLVEEGVNVEDARDGQTLQKMREAILGSAEKIAGLMKELNSAESKDQAVELIVHNEECRVGYTDLIRILEDESAHLLSAHDADRAVVRRWRQWSVLLQWYTKIFEAFNAIETTENEELTSANHKFDKNLLELSESGVYALLSNVNNAWKCNKQTRMDLPIKWRQFLGHFTVLLKDGDVTNIRLEDKVNVGSSHLAATLFWPYFRRRIVLSTFVDQLVLLDREEAFQMLCHWWLSSDFPLTDDLTTSIQLLERLVSALYPSPPACLSYIHTLIEKSPNLSAGLTLCFVLMTTFLPRAHQADQSTMEGETTSDDWESICKENVEWTRLSQRLESLLSLQGFLVGFLPAGRLLEECGEELSVRAYLGRGHAAASEYLAAWSAKGLLHLPPTCIMQSSYSADIEILLPSLESEAKDDRPLRLLSVTDLSFAHQEVTGALTLLKAILPRSLQADLLLSECAWAHMAAWHRDAQQVDGLKLAVSYMQDILQGQLVHGLASLMWRTFLVERISTCADVLEKAGKTPREKLFARDLNMTESAVGDLLSLAQAVLSFLIDADVTSEIKSVNLDRDFLWNDVEVVGRASVAELALQQASSRTTTAPLVSHHLILLDILRAILQFNLKNIKPLSLFDFKAREAFFADLTTHPLLSILEVDQTMERHRLQFLTRALAAVVTYATEHVLTPNVEWVERLLHVGDYWGIGGDEVRSVYALELYSHGLDDLGEETFNAMTDKQPLLNRLLILAGQRLSILINAGDSRQDFARSLSSMTPKMGNWIRSMDSSGLANQNVEWSSTMVLLRNIAHAMNKYNTDYKLCQEVYEWIQAV